MNPADLVDAALETTIAPSFTKIGYAVRRRLDHWRPLDSYDMAGRTVVVTGATSGLGRQLPNAWRCSGLGSSSPAATTARTARAAAEIPPCPATSTCIAIAADMGELDQVTSLAGEIRQIHRPASTC